MNLRKQPYPKIKHNKEMEQKMQKKLEQQKWGEYKCLLSLYKEMFSEKRR